MDLRLQVSLMVICWFTLAASQYYDYPPAPVVELEEVDLDLDERAMAEHHHGGGGGGGGGGGASKDHKKATSYQVSNNWAYHPVKVYVKHHKKH